MFCRYHWHNPPKVPVYNFFDQSVVYSTPCLQLFDVQGRRLCDAYGCKEHHDLISAYNGVFCLKHTLELGRLRKIIEPHSGTFEEYQARLEELRLRKVLEPGHAHYLSQLEKVYVQ